MHMRRFTRLTNAFSKKIENHACAVALHTMFYNFVRIHQIAPGSRRGSGKWTTWVEMLEAWEAKKLRGASLAG
jgi:hypothetical protein